MTGFIVGVLVAIYTAIQRMTPVQSIKFTAVAGVLYLILFALFRFYF